MIKFLFILSTVAVLAAYFYKNPNRLPWIATEYNKPNGYMVYNQGECRGTECSIIRQFFTVEECRMRIQDIYDTRKKNPTLDLFSDRAYCYSGCFRRTNGDLHPLEEGICKVKEEVRLGGLSDNF